MELFRIAKCPYIRDLSGTGARLYGGRWNHRGQAVLYTAGSRSLAALEALVHVPQKNITADFCILILNLPDDISPATLKAEELPAGWQSVLPQPALQGLGDQWLQEGEYAVLRVPSAIIPQEYNYLINPLHREVKKIRIKQVSPFAFDERLGAS